MEPLQTRVETRFGLMLITIWSERRAVAWFSYDNPAVLNRVAYTVTVELNLDGTEWRWNRSSAQFRRVDGKAPNWRGNQFQTITREMERLLLDYISNNPTAMFQAGVCQRRQMITRENYNLEKDKRRVTDRETKINSMEIELQDYIKQSPALSNST
jgi:hypothetical protein